MIRTDATMTAPLATQARRGGEVGTFGQWEKRPSPLQASHFQSSACDRATRTTLRGFRPLTVFSAAIWAVVALFLFAVPSTAQSPPEGDLEVPNSVPSEPTYPPAQDTIPFSGVIAKLATRANGTTIPMRFHKWRFVLIDPGGERINLGNRPKANYYWSGLVPTPPDKWTFSGHFFRRDGKDWDEGVYTVEFQAQYKQSTDDAWSGWATIDSGKFTIKRDDLGEGVIDQ